ncbi:MAG TPA: DinB family protein, partial [Lacipirellulaceae bacterium]|nr:DinB family protein [Lacipirellulaceae bacterium]
MIDYTKHILQSQYEACLSMLGECIRQCPAEHWEGTIGQASFRWAAYHALFFADLYLSPNEAAFELRDLNVRGGDERKPVQAPGLPQSDALTYVPICRQKVFESIAAETVESLAGPSGFSWYKVTRGEMHLINIRHIQHHTGQLSAYLRKADERLK